MHPIPVFAGPSLTADDRRRAGFDWRPPAAAGDLIALLDEPPPSLCLIDGYFDRCAAPWHKEILLLMAAGTRVLGAASMGALRAAELERFGMTGIGAIFRAYREGRLTGDDEVALVHAPERLRWTPLSVPMVEVRATLVRACREGLVDPPTARRIRDAVHAIHFDSRDWPAMEQRCEATGVAGGGLLRRLAKMHVPLKRLDALQCLDAALRGERTTRPAAVVPVTHFIAELARQRGVDLRPPRAPPRGPRTAAPRPSRRTDGGT